MELIRSYFPDLGPDQVKQFAALGPLYQDWNEKINLISRKDIIHLYEHHVLHSLAIAKYDPFENRMHILDAGTGGGFPGIPLAIMFPEIQFTLLDSTAKKIHVVEQVVSAIGLENVKGVHARVEEHKGEYDMVISRAVSTLSQMITWTKHLVPSNRWIILKGGDPKDLRKELPPQYVMTFIPINTFFKEEYFDRKFLIDVKGKV
jgi:16S rRNA (guanine527-N7)-methyltransferase